MRGERGERKETENRGGKQRKKGVRRGGPGE